MSPAAQAGWEALFWVVFERSANPISLLDEQRRFVEVNPPVLSALGYTRGNLIGRSITDVIKRSEQAESWDAWREFLRTGEYCGTRTFVRGDGSEVRYGFAARVVSVGDRRLAVYVTAIDHEAKRFGRAGVADVTALTQREREVVTHIALGDSTAQIAEELTISPETVRTHVRNAMRKLGVRTRAQLVAVTLSIQAPVHLPRLE